MQVPCRNLGCVPALCNDLEGRKSRFSGTAITGIADFQEQQSLGLCRILPKAEVKSHSQCSQGCVFHCELCLWHHKSHTPGNSSLEKEGATAHPTTRNLLSVQIPPVFLEKAITACLEIRAEQNQLVLGCCSLSHPTSVSPS